MMKETFREEKVRDFLTRKKIMLTTLHELLRRMYSEEISVSTFLEVEQMYVDIFKKEGYVLTLSILRPNQDMYDRYIVYRETVCTKPKTFNSLIQNSKLSALKNMIEVRGYNLNVIKIVSRGTKYNKGKTAVFMQNGKLTQGIIQYYQIGYKTEDPSLSYPLRYHIKKEDGSNTSIIEDKILEIK